MLAGMVCTAKTRISQFFREDLGRLGKPESVDRDKGIIHGVKVLGLKSLNGRRYTLEAIREAVSKYEGLSVNVDHPDKPTDQRSAYDRLAWLENVRVQEDGLYADLHILLTHDLAPKLLEAAEKNPRLFGLSHNARGSGEQLPDGTFEIRSIDEVISVDIVADPATTSGLYESKGYVMKKSLKLFLEALLPKVPAKRRPGLKKLLEMDDMDEPLKMEMDEPAAPVDGEKKLNWKQHLVNAIGTLVGSDDPAAHEMAKKIMAMLKPEAAVEEEGEEEGDEEGDEEDEKEVEESGSDEIRGRNQDGQRRAMFAKDPDGAESLRRKVAELEHREHVRELCEEIKVVPDKPLFKALVALRDDKDIRALLERDKKLQESSRQERPRSRAAGEHITENRKESKFPASAAEFKRMLASN